MINEPEEDVPPWRWGLIKIDNYCNLDGTFLCCYRKRAVAEGAAIPSRIIELDTKKACFSFSYIEIDFSKSIIPYEV